MSRRLIVIFYTLLSIMWCHSSYASTVVSDFRTADKDDYSRFVLDINQSPTYNIFILENPHRLVIDIPNAVWDVDGKTHNETKRILGVRHALKNDTLRVVLDVNQPIAVKKKIILDKTPTSPYRLVVDISPTNTMLDAFAMPLPVTKEGRTLSVPTPSLKKRKKPLIVIDAGHGGKDPGAIAYNKKTYEKNITLAYAKQLQNDLKKTGRYRVFMTRDTDVFVTLRNRVKKAEKAKGDLFISLHADSARNRKARGLSVYTLSEKASDKEADALARKENAAGVIGEIDVEENSDDITALLIDLVQRDTKNISASFAETIVKELRKEFRFVRNAHRFAGFRVLTGAKVPSVLVELGYLSNRKDEKLLRDKSYKRKLTKSLVHAIDAHFKKYPYDGKINE